MKNARRVGARRAVELQMMKENRVSDAPKNSKLSEAEQEAVRERVLEIIRTEDITRRQVASESGIPYGTLTPFLGATYASDGSRIAQSLTIWIASRAKREAVRAVAPAPRFVPTPSSADMMRVLAHGQHMPDMVVIIGAPGTGKSSAACEYTRTNPNVWKLVASPALDSIRSLLGTVAQLLGVYDTHSKYRIERGIMQKLQGSGGLLIVDEAQHLSSAMLDQMRSFHDQAGIGIALVGNEKVVSRLEGGQKTSEYAQLYSRVGMRLKRPKPKAGDAEALLDAWGVADGTAREQLRAVSRLPGGLRNLNKCWRLAQMVAANEGRPLEASDVQMAWKQLSTQPIGEAA